MPLQNSGTNGRGKPFAKIKDRCIFRIHSENPNREGCTGNESGYCQRLDCPFVRGYVNRVNMEWRD